MCKICKFMADSKDKIVNHMAESHPTDEDLENYSDFETTKENSSDESITECEVKPKHRSSKTMNSDTSRQTHGIILKLMRGFIKNYIII